MLETERYKLQKIDDGSKWLVTDKENLITISFEEHKFNETQNVVELQDFTHEQIEMLPRILREIGDWLFENHYDKIF